MLQRHRYIVRLYLMYRQVQQLPTPRHGPHLFRYQEFLHVYHHHHRHQPRLLFHQSLHLAEQVGLKIRRLRRQIDQLVQKHHHRLRQSLLQHCLVVEFRMLIRHLHQFDRHWYLFQLHLQIMYKLNQH